jgi:hypothetical protein
MCWQSSSWKQRLELTLKGAASSDEESPQPWIDRLRLKVIRYYFMATITFKVTEEEARLIRSRAREERISVSEYLRRRASISMPASRKPRQVRCPHTGAMIFAGLENQPPLTTESVRELLSDFP